MLFVGCVLALPFGVLVMRANFPRALLVMGIGVVMTSGVIASVGLVSLGRPQPDDYLSLYDRVTLEPGGSVSLAGVPFTYQTTVKPAALLGERSCQLSATYGDHVETRRVEATYSPTLLADVCPRLRAYGDAASSVIVITSFDSDRAIAILPTRSAYIAEPTLVGEQEVRVDDLVGRLGAPRMWVVTGVVGSLLGAVAVLLALRASRRRTQLQTAVDAHHTGGGWVSSDEHHVAPRYVPEIVGTSPGDVVVMRYAEQAPTYRRDGAPSSIHVVRGTRASLADEARARAAAWACVAVATSVMTSAELWVARLSGLL